MKLFGEEIAVDYTITLEKDLKISWNQLIGNIYLNLKCLSECKDWPSECNASWILK